MNTEMAAPVAERLRALFLISNLPAPIAQGVERPLRDRGVAGSILGRAIPKA